MADRDDYAIFARQFPNGHMMQVARDRLWDYMAERVRDPRRADPPPMTLGAGLDADSAMAFVVIVAPREHAPEVELLVGKYVRGDELALDEIPDDYIAGLLERRRRSVPGALLRIDLHRPGTMRRDGRVEDW